MSNFEIAHFVRSHTLQTWRDAVSWHCHLILLPWTTNFPVSLLHWTSGVTTSSSSC